jgi:hypothetical protein
MARGAVCAEPKAIGSAHHHQRRHEDGTQARAAAFERRFLRGGAVLPVALGEGAEEDRVRDRDADRHHRPHERLEVQGGAGDEEGEPDSGENGGKGRHYRKRYPDRLEVSDEEEEHGDDGEQNGKPQVPEHLRERRELAAHAHVHTAGRLGNGSDRLAHLGSGRAQIRLVDVRGHGDHPLHVAPVELAEGLARAQRGDVAKERGYGRAVLVHRDSGHVFDGAHPDLRKLHLHLIGDPRGRVGPVDRSGEPARPGYRCESPADVGDAHVELGGALAIDVDAERRILE